MFGCIGRLVVLGVLLVAGAVAYFTRSSWEPTVRARLGHKPAAVAAALTMPLSIRTSPRKWHWGLAGLAAALERIGWTVKRQSGSHRTLQRPGWPDFVFAFHDGDEIGPRMLARIAKHTGLREDDL